MHRKKLTMIAMELWMDMDNEVLVDLAEDFRGDLIRMISEIFSHHFLVVDLVDNPDQGLENEPIYERISRYGFVSHSRMLSRVRVEKSNLIEQLLVITVVEKVEKQKLVSHVMDMDK